MAGRETSKSLPLLPAAHYILLADDDHPFVARKSHLVSTVHTIAETELVKYQIAARLQGQREREREKLQNFGSKSSAVLRLAYELR